MRIIWLEKAGKKLDKVIGAILRARCAVYGHRWKRLPEYLGAPPGTEECAVCGARRPRP